MNTDPLAEKWLAFGMQVTECQGNDMASVVATLEELKQEGKPNVVIAHTTKGAGISLYKGVRNGITGCRKAMKLNRHWRNSKMRNSEHLANVMVQAFIDAVNEDRFGACGG